jgi:hypothetical protein
MQLLNGLGELWGYVQGTKKDLVRTIIFSIDYSNSATVRVISVLKRGTSTQSEVEVIASTVSVGNWFIVRLDFDSDTDSAFAVGHCGPFSLSVARIAQHISPNYIFRNYESKSSLEKCIWDHLFPLHDTPGAAGAIVVEGAASSFPRFKYLGSVNVRDMCRKGQSAFLIHSGAVVLLNPDMDCPTCGIRTLASSEREQTVYAFMKADLAEYLKSIDPRTNFTFLSDISSCADAVIFQRRRSSQDVLSPPTLEKYQKGPSKRRKNFNIN